MAPRGNRLKKVEDVIDIPPDNGKSEKKASVKKKTASTSSFKPDLGFLKNERFQKMAGLTLLLFSIYLLIAFSSFFFTWKVDSDKVNGAWLGLLFQPEISVENWLGKIGAILSHLIIQKWFGIAGFVFVLISFLAGFKILFKTDLLPIGKTIRYSFFSFFFVATVLAYLIPAHSELSFLAGAVGMEINRWLMSLLGKPGTGILLVFSAIGFMVMAFNMAFRLPFTKKAIEPETDSKEEVESALYSLAGNRMREENQNENENENESEVREESESEENENESESESDNENESEENDPDNHQIAFDIGNDTIPVPVTSTELEINLPELQDDLPTDESQIPLSIEINTAEETATGEEEIGETEVQGEYDPKLDLSSYQFPILDLLENYSTSRSQLSRDELKAELETNKNRIVETLGHYNIAIDKIKATVGPTVTLFEIIPQAGVRISKIKNLEDDIALSLSALGIRIIAPIPGKGTIGIEVPNQNPETVSMRSVIASEKFQSCDYDLPIGLGRTISNEVYIADLAKMPHLLMAGATGQGKSVGLNAVLVSLLYKKHPSQVKFVLVDPKKVELTLFKTIERHFLAKLPGEEEAIITDTRKVVNTLNSLCMEMDQRYELLKDAQVRNIKEYNAKFVSRRLNPKNGHHFLPYIVLVVDEFADLIMTAGKEVETPIARLAQLARAIGIHLIIATQRPSVNIITGTIKANFPARMAFRVTAKVDSRTILDAGGADQLIGRGDMLLSTGADIIRLQCAFVDTPEVEKITSFIGNQRGYPDAFLLPEYVGENESGGANEMNPDERDALFEEAARMVVQHQQGSASLLQRRLKLGYNRAGRLIDQLEAAGILGPFEGSKAREVRIKDILALEQFLNVGDKT